MKRTITLFAMVAVLALSAVSVLGQEQCTDENKDLWYAKTFLPNFKGDPAQQKVAYDAAKKYIAACAADQYSEYMQKKFVEPYEGNQATAAVGKQFEAAVASKNYGQQMTLGKQILAKTPDNADVTVILGVVGLAEATLLNESAQFASKGIDLLNGGKTAKVYTKDQALAYLNWTVGKSKITSAPADAITSLLKAAKIESEVKKNPQLYLDLAAAYENGPRAKLSADYKGQTNPDGTESAQGKVILENLNRVIDNQIDAMARAAALAPDAASKQAVVTELTALYKYRNKTATDANVNELVASVLAKPIPDVPTPVTSLPGPAPTSTPTSTSGTNGTPPATGPTSPSATKPPANTTTNTSTTGSKTGTATGTATPTSTPKPTTTPTPRKPRVKHHRG